MPTQPGGADEANEVVVAGRGELAVVRDRAAAARDRFATVSIGLTSRPLTATGQAWRDGEPSRVRCRWPSQPLWNHQHAAV